MINSERLERIKLLYQRSLVDFFSSTLSAFNVSMLPHLRRMYAVKYFVSLGILMCLGYRINGNKITGISGLASLLRTGFKPFLYNTKNKQQATLFYFKILVTKTQPQVL